MVLSPLQTVTSKRRARTFPRDISASVFAVVEPKAGQALLGAVEDRSLTLSQLVGEAGVDAPGIRLGMPPADCYPSLLKFKTADDANFLKNQAFMSATETARNGAAALGSCGRTAAFETKAATSQANLRENNQ